MENMQNQVIFDWVTIRSRIDTPQTMLERLKMKEDCHFEVCKGRYGYRDRLAWDNISILYNGREDMGVCLEMSGQGCRAWETFGSGDYDALFADLEQEPEEYHITRLDVAYDDHSGIIPMGKLLSDARNEHYVSKAKRGNMLLGLGDARGEDSITLGSRTSLVLLRIYDKARERGYLDGRHWIRVELMLKDERALAFLQEMATGGIGTTFQGVLANYCRFVEPSGEDSNRWRWPMRQYWADLLDAAAPIRLYTKPGAEYNMLNLETFVLTQAGGAIYTYLECYGVQRLAQALKDEKVQLKLNPKYRRLLDQYRRRGYNDDII